MKKKPKYKGVLNEPMNVEDGIGPFLERLMALYKYYDTTDPNELMLHLARDHVRGFQVKELPYDETSEARKYATRDLIIFCKLYKVEAEGGNVLAAARTLAQKHSDWGKAETINLRYQDLKSQNDRGKKNTARIIDLIKLLNSD